MTEKKELKMCQYFCIKPLNKETLANIYIPALGMSNYMVLSVNVMNPRLVSKLIPSQDVTNILLINSVLGTALYIYNRPHLFNAPTRMRLTYSCYNSVMFNFGSVLLWAVFRRLLPNSNCIATIFGIVSSVGLITVGRNCLALLDSSKSDSSSQK